MNRLSLKDGEDSFDVTLIEVEDHSRIVLFAVGGGGDPHRHLPLLKALAAHGCTVVAPHFERLVSASPTADDLRLRARRLRLALNSVASPDAAVAGVGHSIGSTMLLALAGGKVWMRSGQPLSITPDARIDRLALLAPATGYFQAPGALDAMQTPLLAWAGTKDVITPPEQAELLANVLGPGVAVDIRITKDAGHFSFMNQPPPQSTEPLADREAFLTEITTAVCSFVSR